MILDCTVGMNFTSFYYLDMDLKTKTQFALTDYSNGEYNIVKKSILNIFYMYWKTDVN